MKGKRPHPLIGMLSGLLTAGGGRTGPSDGQPSPKTPLDVKTQSPRGLRHSDLGAVGLGIVAALEKSSTMTKYCVCGTGLGRSADPRKRCERLGRRGSEDDCLENYTYVTCHRRDRSLTLVYYDGGQGGQRVNSCFGFGKVDGSGVLREPRLRSEEDVGMLPSLEFLSSCDLCGKKLHGRDVYMYRGEKAFCSIDCRSNHIISDERKDQKCRSETSKSVDFSCSPYTKDQIFSTGILAI